MRRGDKVTVEMLGGEQWEIEILEIEDGVVTFKFVSGPWKGETDVWQRENLRVVKK